MPQMDEQTRKEKFRIVNIEFEGVERTKSSVLAKIVVDIYAAQSLDEFLKKYQLVAKKLEPLFQGVDVRVEPVDPGNNKVDHVITFIVSERSRRRLGTEIQADGQTTHLSLNFLAPNLNGIGDSIRLAFKSNSFPHIHAADFEYAIPLVPWKLLYNPVYSLGYSQFKHHALPSAYDQVNKSIIQRLDLFSHEHVKHSLSFINTWTHIKSSSPQTPLVIREQSGHFLKSYLRYAIQFDNRQLQENYPENGILARLSTDLSTNLFKRGAKFTRHEVELQLNKLLIPRYGLLGQLNLYAGTLLKASKIDISDRFFPGGVPNFRGFEAQAFGPHANKHPLGNISYLTAGLHVYPILPGTTVHSRINQFIRPQLFVNTGLVGDLNRGLGTMTSRDDLMREIVNFRDSLRYSCGVGLMFSYMGIRFELNYCLPLRSKDGDLTVPGLQFGFYSAR